MADERITDGTRIAQLLASELDGRTDGGLGAVSVVDADPDVEATADGGRAYDVAVAVSDDPDDGRRLARVFVHEDRARLAFGGDERCRDGHVLDAARDAAESSTETAGLRVRTDSDAPPHTAVSIERGAAVKGATDLVQAILTTVSTES